MKTVQFTVPRSDYHPITKIKVVRLGQPDETSNLDSSHKTIQMPADQTMKVTALYCNQRGQPDPAMNEVTLQEPAPTKPKPAPKPTPPKPKDDKEIAQQERKEANLP